MRNHPSDGLFRRVRTERSPRAIPPTLPTPTAADPERQTLRVGAKALITNLDRVLLIKECHGDSSTFWTLPGGGVESGESFTTCLRREIREEIRCRATVGESIGRYVYHHTSSPTTTVYAIFDAALLSEPEPNREERVLDYAWSEPSELPATTLDPVERFIERSVTGTDGGR
ncbi:NUDIX hydrolase [Halorubrum cibi]|uniref:ADP-ribose pyrophosphatase YjhB, NUDIX family n=1 Tax=Halorubrum cibi TaxID=413815 RepID=A0A521C3R7_9EURY|nr:NUDIX domain-containing protein [Halorubrum cibi]SMO54126.1 ADP-ribose pyrophosphatase YjhB, NUDIX family [Halorubrum cibi]